MKQTIDALGWDCPKPIIATKKALDTITTGEVITLVDNQIALDNLLDFAHSLGYEASYTKEEGPSNTIYRVSTQKTIEDFLPEAASATNLVIVITNDQLGAGSEDLGKALMKTYLYTLTETEHKPKTIIFINKGVFLNCQGSAEAETIAALEVAGVEVLSCGACLNFYGLTESLGVGSISNMYAIVEKMNAGTNTIKI